ncbi:DUF6174 domain-containing protein [Candidatus Thiothrix sp. Deng01]|uniref:DUF6174 domain-containing protein n=1 Tax=Candidatus Thiothrix phosphatis TaxID=3112415 RepID=A0ABU6D0B0_9GAMM|nr:DUF6174 domain-containing protein [Candidatus Thiothrix sp. Deng01]MEB4592501.1 DUF6174 domain-containing protein [Candidatus Thiothrix sp. Deng01]
MKRLLTTVLLAASLSACALPPTPGTTPTLTLQDTQLTALRTLMGLMPSSPFTVKVLDQDRSNTLSIGDIAILSGGITAGEISRRTLSASDIQTINANLKPDYGSLAQQLLAVETQWRQKRPSHYAYTLQRSCFCTPEARKPLEIRVFRNTVQQATILPDGKPLPKARKAEALTIDELFEVVRRAINNQAASIDVTYDPLYGFPTTIFIDQDKMIADEEINYAASNFKIASGLKPKQ